MTRLSFFFVLLIFSSCKNNLETVENKDDQGNLIERYTRDKEDFSKMGLYTRFFKNGQKAEEANYQKDTLHGDRKMYYENGQVEIHELYQNGLFEGAYKTYYESGQLAQEGNYINNQMQGEWKRYYKSGQLMEVATFKDNEENGAFKEYHENGNQKAEGEYLNGDNEHGLLKLYSESGELEKKMQCKNGICRTIWTKEGGDQEMQESIKL